MQAIPGGGLHYGTGGTTPSGIELKFTFKEGGAPDFQGKFEAIKERLQQVVDVARSTNGVQSRPGGGGNSGAGMDLTNVHLDQLPRYEDSGADRMAPEEDVSRMEEDERPVVVPSSATADQVRAMAAVAATQRRDEAVRRRSREQEAEMVNEVPADAPPGYEEAQMESVQAEMEWRLNLEDQPNGTSVR